MWILTKLHLQKIFLNGLIFITSILLFLIVLEMTIRIFTSQSVNIKGTRFSNILIYENIPRAVFTIRSPEFETEVVYNNEGFRDNDFKIEKKGLRIAILGDSYVEALQVPFETMFTNQLEGLLNKGSEPVEVMNFGVSGYGTDKELIMLRNKVLKYKPDVVLLMYVYNDIQEILTNSLIRYENGKLSYRILNPNPIWKNFKAFIRNLHAYYFLKKKILQLPIINRTVDRIKILFFDLLGEKFVSKYFPQIARDARHVKDRAGISVELQAFLNPLHEEVEKLWDLEFKILKEFLNNSQKNHAKFAIVISTKDIQLDEHALHETLTRFHIDKSRFIPNNPNKTLVDFAEKNNIPILDLYPIFKKQALEGKMLHFKKDGHWNKLGHALAAKEIYKFLEKNGLIGGTKTGT